MNELWLHVGGPKTGTSAIQCGAVLNRDHLLAEGILYPPSKTDDAARRGQVTSGNGAPFAAYLLSGHEVEVRRGAEQRIDCLLADAESSGVRRMLVSSELMAEPDPLQLDRLLELVTRRGWRVRVLFYVRHIADQAVSIFGQRTKRGELLQPATFYESYRSPSFGIETYVAGLGECAVNVRSYDSDKSSLIQTFFATLGVSTDRLSIPNAVINRSANHVELASIREASSILRPSESRALTNIFRDTVHEFLSSNVEKKEPATIEPHEVANLLQSHESLIQTINNGFFSGEAMVKLRSDELQIGTRASYPEPDRKIVSRLVALVQAQSVRLETG